MKYYHIIYNSSEKPMSGGTGFGIRTATEGTPSELLEAIKNITYFTDDWTSYNITTEKFNENIALIEQVPKNYAITTLTDNVGKKYYLVARRVYVGYDHSFYQNNKPTRPGNYVIDYYVFESAPCGCVYEILYENALPGSNHFIPKSVLPTTDNEEMRTISVGAQEALPIEEKPFKANLQDKLTKDAVKLFFHYLQAKSNNRKLLVKVSSDKAQRLLADFYRMLGDKLAAEVRTYVNLRSEGLNDNFDINFIHEDYAYPIYHGGFYDYVEIETAEMPDTLEAKTFANDLVNLVSNSYEENKEDVNDLLKWVTMPEHDIVKNMSKETNDAFFSYCIQPGNFLYTSIKNEKGELNHELLPVLCSYIKNNNGAAERFNTLITETMSEITPDTAIALVKEYNELIKIGFSLNEITTNVKSKVCSVILSDISLFRTLLDEAHLENISKFFVKEQFEEKQSYLDSAQLDKYITKLYTWFYTEEELKKKGQCLWRFMKRDIDKEIMFSLIDDVYQENEQKIKFLIEILNKELKPFEVVWGYMKNYLEKMAENTDFIAIFESRTGIEEYAPMFYYSLKKGRENLNTLEKIAQTSELLSKNKALKKLVEENFAADNIYKAYYNLVDTKCEKDPQKYLEHIKENVFDFLNIKDDKWNVLKKYIELIIACEEKKSEKLDKATLVGVYEKVVEHNNAKLFAALLNSVTSLVKNCYIDIKSFVADYKKMNPGKDCIATLAELDANKEWQELASAVIVKSFNMKFADAVHTLDEYGYSQAFKEHLLMKHYEKEYKRYKLTNKVKNFFKSLTSLFGSKKKENKKEEKSVKGKTKK